MNFPKDVVETSIGLYTDGLSLRKVRKRIKKIYKILIKSNQTILDWLIRFGKKPKQVLSGLADLLHGDETLIKTYKKGLFFYFWAIKCKGVQPVGWNVSEYRSLYEAKIMLWKAKRRFPIGYYPKAIRTDGFPGYRQAIVEALGHGVKHDKFLSFKNHSNNVIENFFRCKKHFPRFRKLESARKYIDQWMWENFGEDLFFGLLVSYVNWIQSKISRKTSLCNQRSRGNGWTWLSWCNRIRKF